MEKLESKKLVERLYHTERQKVFGFLCKKLNSREEAEDMTSNVFLEAARSAESFDPSKSAESTWLFSICRNLLNRHLRDLYTHKRIHDANFNPSEEETFSADEIDGFIQRDCLFEALSTLPETQRNIIILRYYKGLSPSEIAERLALSYSNVCVQTNRALAKLRELLQSR
ncbi:MAG: sigma-70 family RNA polymerase sigma factor [Spirochaetaceae bacterium]|nr:sigma-70 family RNA polymerase sigma factor [Spirochaetaceae bacterium]